MCGSSITPAIANFTAAVRLLGGVDGVSRVRGDLHARFGGDCALQAHTVQPSEMAALIKRSQQSGTESCAVYGNVRDEA